MKENGIFSRRDFLKLGGASILAWWLSQNGVAKAIGDPRLPNVEGAGIKEGQYYLPKNTDIFLLPINKDGFYSNFGTNARNPVSLNLNGGAILQARNIQGVSVNGVSLKIAEIPFAGGDIPGNVDKKIPSNTDQYFAFAVVEAGGKAFYGRTFSQGEIIGAYTGIWKESIYPAKIWNILEASRNLLAYQEAHDGFADGDYSFIDIQKHLADPNFRQGYNFSWNLVTGGGIDGAATILSKSIKPMIDSGKASYRQRVSNPEYFEYFQGPTDASITEQNSDAKINIDSGGGVRNDFSWRFSGNGKVYLNVGVSIIPDGDILSSSWTRLPSDRLVLSYYWSKNKPSSKGSDEIEKIMTSYGKYRAEGFAGNAFISMGSEYPARWEDALKISEQVRPEMDTLDFVGEINGADKNAKANMVEFLVKMQKTGKELKDMNPVDVQKFYYSFIYYMRDTVNEFNNLYPYTAADEIAKRPRPSQKLGTFLVSKMESDGFLWALTKALPEFSNAIYELNDNTYLRGDQSIQCLIWVSFLGRIGFPDSPSYVGGTSSGTASGLVTDFVREALKYVDTAADPRHAELKFARPHKIENVQVGDSFVRWGGDNNHIGTVIGKKVVGGETRLLITDANRKNDGTVRVFEVKNDNFRLVFGNDEEDIFPVVIRK